MRLVDTATGEEAIVGNVYNGYMLSFFRPPHKPASSGKCSVVTEAGDTREYYVGVLGLEWVEREDRGGASMPKHFHTVQVQYDEITEKWWVHYLDDMGWPTATPRYMQLEKQATDHAKGIFDRGNADHYVKFKADGEQEESASRIRRVP